jgi:CheY-like chemotaxis protein
MVEELPARVAAKILVVNDSPDFLDFMRELLVIEGGYDVATFDQSEGVVEQVTGSPPDLIILDFVFGARRVGVEVADLLAASEATAGIPILFCTALSERDIPDDVRERIAARGQRIIYKPFDVDHLLRDVAELMDSVASRDTA